MTKLPDTKQANKYVYREFTFDISSSEAVTNFLDALEDISTGTTIAEVATGGYRVKRVFIQPSGVGTYNEIYAIGRGTGTDDFTGNIIGVLNVNEGGMDFEINTQGNTITTKKTAVITAETSATFTVKIGIEYTPAIDETYTNAVA